MASRPPPSSGGASSSTAPLATVRATIAEDGTVALAIGFAAELSADDEHEPSRSPSPSRKQPDLPSTPECRRQLATGLPPRDYTYTELIAKLGQMLTNHSDRFAMEIRKPGPKSPAIIGDMPVTREQFCTRVLRLVRLELWHMPPPMLRKALGQIFDSWDIENQGALNILELCRIMLRHGSPRKPRTSRKHCISQAEIRLSPPRPRSQQQLRRVSASEGGLRTPAVSADSKNRLSVALSAIADRVLDTLRTWLPEGQERIGRRELLQAVTLLVPRDDWQQRSVIDAYFDSLADARGGIELMRLELALRRPFSQPKPLTREGTPVGRAPAGAPPHAAALGTPSTLGRGHARGSMQARLGQMELERDGVSFRDQLRATLGRKAMRVTDLFVEWDLDNDGIVSKEEFRKSLTQLGVIVSKPELESVFEQFDKDHNGNISIRELNAALRPMKEAKVKHEVHVKRVQILDVNAIRSQTKNHYLQASHTYSIQAPKPMPTNPLRLNPLTGKHVWNHDHRERHDTFASEAASVTAAAAASSPTEEWPPKMPPLLPLRRASSHKEKIAIAKLMADGHVLESDVTLDDDDDDAAPPSSVPASAEGVA